MIQFDTRPVTNVADSWAYDKHLLITGASSGIGRHLSEYYMGVCKKLTLVSRNTDGRLDEAVERLHGIGKLALGQGAYVDTRLEPRTVDVRDKDSISALIGQAYEEPGGQVDGFVNCAGGSHRFALLERMSNDDIDEIIDTNAKAPIYWLRELLPYMKHNAMSDGGVKRGHIVMMSSRSGERPLPNLSVYAAAKACVEKLLEAVRAEYACHRIAFTLINPGSINTAFTERWPEHLREIHNAESMTVAQAITPIVHTLNSEFVYNKVSYESLEQWFGEPGVLEGGD